MGLARVRASRSQAVVQLLQQGVEKELDEVAEKLREEVLEEMGSQLDGDESENAEVLMRVHLRYDGTDTSIPVLLSDLNQMSAAFEKAHRRQFGFVFEGRNLVVEAVEVEAVSLAGRSRLQTWVLLMLRMKAVGRLSSFLVESGCRRRFGIVRL